MVWEVCISLTLRSVVPLFSQSDERRRQVGTQITEIQALVDAAQEMLGRDVIFQIERVEQALLSSR